VNYKQALKYLDSFINYEQIGLDNPGMDLDPGRLRNVLKRMKDPHRDYPCVHVAGTKGKGSVCAFTSSILEKSGYRVGLFTSPHLVTVRERIKINGRIIGKSDLAGVVERLKEYIDPRVVGKELTYFEVLTLAAILYFSLQKVDYAVFEVGMGGRLDATNVIDAKVCGISPVSYSPQRQPALRVIKDRCRDEDASLSLVGKDITCSTLHLDEKGSCVDIAGLNGYYEKCRINMPGDFQPSNCATAVGICEQLLGAKGIDEDALKKGISSAFIPGRMEVICRRPLVVIDGAQNGDSAERLKYSVEQIFKYDRLILLLGFSRDKDIKTVCRHLVPVADEVVLTRASVDRAADPHLIRGYIKGKSVRITSDVKEALGVAFSRAGKNDMILATGSFFVIGEVRGLLVGAQSEDDGRR